MSQCPDAPAKLFMTTSGGAFHMESGCLGLSSVAVTSFISEYSWICIVSVGPCMEQDDHTMDCKLSRSLDSDVGLCQLPLLTLQGAPRCPQSHSYYSYLTPVSACSRVSWCNSRAVLSNGVRRSWYILTSTTPSTLKEHPISWSAYP